MSRSVLLALMLPSLMLAPAALGDPPHEGTLEAMPTGPAPVMEPGLTRHRSGLEKSHGDVVGSLVFDQGCTQSSIGLGIAFDGDNLWFSCSNQSPDLFRADNQTGVVTATYNIAGGLGAIAYDCTDNSIVAGWGGGDPNGTIRRIALDGDQDVTGSSVLFSVGQHPMVCSLDDGIAIDVTTNPRQIYISSDCSTIIHRYAYDGTHVDAVDDSPWTGTGGCYNSGLALGGDSLYQSANGCNHLYIHPKSPWPMVGPNTTDFSTIVPSDPQFRDEGLACDDSTFSVDVMWSVDAYEPRRVHAFEVPDQTCQTCAAPPPDPCDLPTPASVGAALRLRDRGPGPGPQPNAPNNFVTLDWTLDEGGPRALGTDEDEQHYHVLRGRLLRGRTPTFVRIPNTEPWVGTTLLDMTPRAVETPHVWGYVIKAADACETESIDWPPSL